jgi:hypothetical protein
MQHERQEERHLIRFSFFTGRDANLRSRPLLKSTTAIAGGFSRPGYNGQATNIDVEYGFSIE